METLEYTFSGELWSWRGKKTDWIFITLPDDVSEHARYFTGHIQRGFKSLKVNAQIGDSQWQTSMFPSKARQAYLLPVKKSIREAQNIGPGDATKVKITLLGL